MKRIIKIPLILVISIIFSSCKDDSDPASRDGYFVFGEAYGFCAGDCAHFYKIEGGKLFRDNIERYGVDMPTFNDVPDDQSNYDLAESLVNSFPKYLINNANQTFGCPDCADQGGYHLYLQNGTEILFWHIDTFADNQPEEIRPYVAQLREILVQLRD
ncbi:MAG TPA: hypothetical protein P5280_04525 [Cyclobacteriaceae bacterium]|nr:hypothetical protein [Cyclobacteriaceae bacterium]